MYNPNNQLIIDLAQIEADTSRGFAVGQERSLVVAILADGLQALFAPRNKRNYRRIKEALAWVSLNDSEYIFSFINICEALGIDADHLRVAIIKQIGFLENSQEHHSIAA